MAKCLPTSFRGARNLGGCTYRVNSNLGDFFEIFGLPNTTFLMQGIFDKIGLIPQASSHVEA